MSSLPKTGFARKTGNVILGVTLLGSLMLTACAPAAQTNDSAPNPTAATATPTADAIPKIEFKSETFDEAKQVSLTIKEDDRNLYLSSGVVAVSENDEKKTVFAFTPYEGTAEKWEYVTETALKQTTVSQRTKANLMRWKDKSYVVVQGVSVVTEAASGLTAEKNVEIETVVVLDAATGKVVNTINSKPTEYTGGRITSEGYDNLYLINDETVPDNEGEVTPPQGLSHVQPFMTGLVFGNGSITKLVDPLTGQDVATDTNKTQNYNEAGFYKVGEVFPFKNYGYDGTNVEGVFGNYVLVYNQKKSQNGTEYRLVNTLTKEVISETTCEPQGKRAANGMSLGKGITYSPDFRYVNFFENTVIDTKTGASFCTEPVDKPEVRPFIVTHVNNNGDMFGSVSSSDLLKVSLTDSSAKALSWAPNEAFPSILTDKGSLVLITPGNGGDDDLRLVVIPAK